MTFRRCIYLQAFGGVLEIDNNNMASILSIRMQKCSHITGAVNVLRPFSNVMNMRDVCLQHHSPLDKVKQSATEADFTIHGRKDEKEVRIFNTESISKIEKSQPYGNLNGGNIYRN